MDYVYLIITTINNLALLGLKVIDYLQTEDGKALVAQARTDRAGWDKFWRDAGGELKKFFTGEWWKAADPSPQLRTVADVPPKAAYGETVVDAEKFRQAREEAMKNTPPGYRLVRGGYNEPDYYEPINT